MEIYVDATTFKSAVRETAKELDWEIVQQSSSFIVAVSGFSWRSWGERITLIRDKDQVLFNSICDPDNRSSVASFGMNKLNRKLFEEHLKKAVTKSSVETFGGNS